jgi:hypothetical protein
MAIRGKIFVALLLALTLVALTPAIAADRQQLGDAWWTGPLQTPSANTIPKNHWYIETYFVAEQDNGSYGNSGTKYGANSKAGCAIGIQCGYDNNYTQETLMTYGLMNNFNFQILTAFGGTQGGSGVATTPGIDVELARIRLPYRLVKYKEGNWYPSFSFVPEVNIPVGSSSVWTPGIGFWAIRPFWMPNGRILRIRASEDIWFPKSGKSVSLGNCAAGATTCKMDKAVYGKTQIGFEYSLTKKWVPAFDFVIGNYGGQTKFNGVAATGVTGFTAAGTPIIGTLAGTRSYAVDPALEYNFTENTGIIFGAEITVGGTNAGSYIAPQIALQWFK